MALERLSQVTQSGIVTGIVLSNASVTGVLTATNEFNVGSGLTITSTSSGATLTSSSVTVTGTLVAQSDIRVSSGNTVGIGTDNPTRKLDVEIQTASGVVGSVLSSHPIAEFINISAGAPRGLEIGAPPDGILSPVYLKVSGTSSRFSILDQSNDENFTILDSGNVGVGTSVPQSKLDVAGEVRSSGIAITTSYPTIRPSLNLDFVNSRLLDSRITFTRTTTATYVGPDGLIKTAVDDEPRFDHDPETLESLGLLIEESRSNQIPSSDFSSGWTTASATLVSGISDPEGGTNARKLVTTTTSGTASCFITYNTSITSGNVYTQSVWAKANAFPVSGNAFYVLQMAPSTGFDSRYQNFDLSNGTLGTGDVESATIEAFPDGWYRCSVTQTATTTGSGRIAISLQNSPTDTRLQSISTGSANNDGIYVWGAQLEVGSFPTSYIPTSGSTVTRSQDVADIPPPVIPSFYNQRESTILCNFSQINTVVGSGNERVYRFWLTSGADTRIDYLPSNNDYHPYIARDSVLVANLNGFATLYGGLENRTAVRVKENDFISVLNGEIKATDDNGAWPPTLGDINELNLGNHSGSGQLNGHIKSFVYYPKALPDAQLIALTS